MRKILLMCFLCICYTSKAQDYYPIPDSGMVWVDLLWNWEEDTLEEIYLGTLGTDTIIDDTQYTQLYKFSDTIFDLAHATYFGGFRQEGKKVYYFGENTQGLSFYEHGEELLYDFDLKLGDTISYHFLDYELFSTRVIEVDSVLVDGSYRRLLRFDYGWEWIEGIGNITYGFTQNVLHEYGVEITAMQCAFYNNTLLYHCEECAPDGCFMHYTSIAGLPEKESLTVSPNPVTDFAKIDIKNIPVKNYKIFDITGKLLVNELNAGDNRYIPIQAADFPPGMYTVILTTEKEAYSAKFIVE